MDAFKPYIFHRTFICHQALLWFSVFLYFIGCHTHIKRERMHDSYFIDLDLYVTEEELVNMWPQMEEKEKGGMKRTGHLEPS